MSSDIIKLLRKDRYFVAIFLPIPVRQMAFNKTIRKLKKYPCVRI